MKAAGMKKSEVVIALCAGFLALAMVFTALLVAARLSRSEDSYSSSEVSSYDFNGNGLSDAMDLVLGARADAENHPTYDGRYWQGGYPPDDIGVCTDVVWRAFRAAGYSLRDMVDADIAARPSAYPNITQRDSNIDFRRVKNLRVFSAHMPFPSRPISAIRTHGSPGTSSFSATTSISASFRTSARRADVRTLFTTAVRTTARRTRSGTTR